MSRLWLLGLLLLSIGCNGPVILTVEGEVSYEGEPIADGYIAFVSTDPHVVDAGATIANGKYKMEVQQGPKKVVLTATREEGEIDPAMGARRRFSYLPAEYSSEDSTILTVTIAKDGKRQFDFHLTKPPPQE